MGNENSKMSSGVCTEQVRSKSELGLVRKMRKKELKEIKQSDYITK